MKIVVFGTGSAAKDFFSIVPSHVEIVGLADNNKATHGSRIEGYEVFDPKSLPTLAIDYVVITARAIDEIRAGLEAMGIAGEKIVAYYPSYSKKMHELANRDISILNEKLGLGLAPLGLATMYLDRADDCGEALEQSPADFVRNKAFRLAARQIRNCNVAGAVAELGVYQGDQARLLNALFPDRSLYLFDTFSGFSDRDLGAEQQNNLSSAIVGDFVDTSVELVMSKLPNPAMAKVFPGYFPETAAGIDERFAFVSLDVDLFEPTRAGLHWFYERLSPGGYIFVHDYNNVRYLGVRKAVDGFVQESRACCVPLPDFAGSVIICK